MKPQPSSTSSSERAGATWRPGATLLAWPRPTAAGIVAILTFLAFGAGLSWIGGWLYQAPPSRLHAGILSTAYRYNAGNRPRRAEIILLGDSLMEGGVLEDQLAAALHLKPEEVCNLAMAGGNPWDIEQLVERLDPPCASGPRVAIIQIDRHWFDPTLAPLSNFARYKLRGLPGSPGRGGVWGRLRDELVAIVPERREAREWWLQFRYGCLARLAPRLVPIPTRIPPRIWEISPEAQQIALGAVKRRAAQSVASDGFAEHSVQASQMTIAELQRRSYQVVLLLTPLRREALEAIEKSPTAAARERLMRSLLFDPVRATYSLVEIRDAKALGTDDDAILMDYGHLNRAGAELLTRKLAEAIRQLGLLDPSPTSLTATAQQ
jgi:hypothetical protein